MTRRKQKGFTLVEVLTVVTILGILSIIAIASYSKYIDSAKETKDDNNINNVQMAAEMYAQANKKVLPKMVGEQVVIDLKQLKTSNYLKEDIKNSKDDDCMDRSKVQIIKVDKDQYVYKPILICGDEPELQTPVATTNPKVYIKIGDHVNAELLDSSSNLKTSTATIEYIGDEDNDDVSILSYNYIIYIEDLSDPTSTKKEVMNSGNMLGNKNHTIKITDLSLTEYLQMTGKNKITIIAYMINDKGDSKKVISSLTTQEAVFEDTTPPICPDIDSELITGAAKEDDWYNKNAIRNGEKRTISIKCNDGAGSGCKREIFSKSFPSGQDTVEAGTSTIILEDNVGNKSSCTVRVNIDITSPTVTVQKASGIKKKYEVKDTDKSEYPKGKMPNSDEYYNSHNNWLNGVNYKDGVIYNIKVDDNFTVKNWVWTTDGNEQASGEVNAKNGEFTISFIDDGRRRGTLVVYDTAGNYTTLELEANIDRTAPTVPKTNVYRWQDEGPAKTSSEGLERIEPCVVMDSCRENECPTANFCSWEDKKIYTEASESTDALSGFEHYEYTTGGNTTFSENEAGTYRNIKAEGVSCIKYRACDVAGNCSAYNYPVVVKIDTIPPSKPDVLLYEWANNDTEPTSITGLSPYVPEMWTNKKVIAKVPDVTDSGSGIPVDNYYYTITTPTIQESNKPGKIKSIVDNGISYIKYKVCDRAGNCVESDEKEIRIDTIPPTIAVPEKFFKWSFNEQNPAPTTSDGMGTAYTPGTLSNKKVFTEAPKATDDHSGIPEDGYTYTTTGATTNETNKKGKYRNIEKEGTSYISYKVCDQVNNCTTTEPKEVKVDITYPKIELTFKKGTETYTPGTWTNKTVTVTATVTDVNNLPDRNTFIVLKDGKNVDKSTLNITSNNVLNLSEDGIYEVRYEATDDAGNKTLTDPYIVEIDKTPPSKPVVYLYKWSDNETKPLSNAGLSKYTPETWSNKKIFAICGDSSDAGSGKIKYYSIINNNISSSNEGKAYVETDGTSTVGYKVCDDLNNCQNSDIKTVNIDTVKPTVGISFKKEGSNTIYNPGSWTKENVIATTTARDTHLDSSKNKIDIAHKTNDGTKTVTRYWLSTENPLTMTDEGIYSITFEATDLAGNKSKTEESQIKINRTRIEKPELVLYKWNNNSGTNPTSSRGLTAYREGSWSNKYIYAEVDDPMEEESGESIEYHPYVKTPSASNFSKESESIYYNIKEQGSTSIYFNVISGKGDLQKTATSLTKTVSVDTVAPKVNLSFKVGSNNYDPGTWTKGPVKITATIEETGSKLKNNYFTVTKNGDKKTYNAKTLTLSEDGEYVVEYSAIDNAGNNGKPSVSMYSVKIDKTPPSKPSVSMYKWANNSTVPTSVTGLTSYSTNTLTNHKVYTKASGATDSGSKNVKYYPVINGSKQKASSAKNIISEGTTTIKYKACDDLENCSESNEYKTKIDLTKPNVSLSFKVVKNAYTTDSWTNKDVTITATVTDANKGEGKKNKFIVVKSGNTSNYAGESLTLSKSGKYSVSYYAEDAAGNTKTTSSYTVKIDKAKPSIACKISKDKGIEITSKSDNGGSGINGSSIRYVSSMAGSVDGIKASWVSSNKSIKDGFSTKCGNSALNGYVYVKDNQGNGTYAKCSGSVSQPKCCSKEHPDGCKWVTSCREGKTQMFNYDTENTIAAGVVCHKYVKASFWGDNNKKYCPRSTRLYVISQGTTFTYVCYKPDSEENSWVKGTTNSKGWICGKLYKSCVNPAGQENQVCQYSQCPG